MVMSLVQVLVLYRRTLNGLLHGARMISVGSRHSRTRRREVFHEHWLESLSKVAAQREMELVFLMPLVTTLGLSLVETSRQLWDIASPWHL